MTATMIHDRMKDIVLYPAGYRVRSRCSCGWSSPAYTSAHLTVAQETAQSALRHHQRSQLQPTKGATDDTSKE